MKHLYDIITVDDTFASINDGHVISSRVLSKEDRIVMLRKIKLHNINCIDGDVSDMIDISIVDDKNFMLTFLENCTINCNLLNIDYALVVDEGNCVYEYVHDTFGGDSWEVIDVGGRVTDNGLYLKLVEMVLGELKSSISYSEEMVKMMRLYGYYIPKLSVEWDSSKIESKISACLHALSGYNDKPSVPFLLVSSYIYHRFSSFLSNYGLIDVSYEVPENEIWIFDMSKKINCKIVKSNAHGFNHEHFIVSSYIVKSGLFNSMRITIND